MNSGKRTKSSVTIKDVARAAGVSLGTASRVLNENNSVNADMQAKVRAAMTELGYSPNAVAQSMRLKATQAIAIVVRDTSIIAMSAFIKAAQAVLYEAGYAMIIADTDDDSERELHILQSLARRRIDGLIMTTAADRDDALLAAREALGVPIVLLDREQSGSADTVGIGYRDGTRKAITYLLDLGHRQIALITGSTNVKPARERVLGYEDAFRIAGVEIDRRLIRAHSFSPDHVFAEATALLNEDIPPTAILAGGVDMLPAIMRAVIACDLKIPQDISIIGSLDTELAELSTPPTTIMNVDYVKIGTEAAKLLLGRIDEAAERDAPRRLMFRTELIVRSSCRPIRQT